MANAVTPSMIKAPSATGGGVVNIGGKTMSVPTLGIEPITPGSNRTSSYGIMPSQNSMSQANWNLANNSVSAMRTSGRSPAFMQSHLGQEMQMQSPNWGMTPKQGEMAREMSESGRNATFMQAHLGIGPNQALPAGTSMGTSHASTPMPRPTVMAPTSTPKMSLQFQQPTMATQTATMSSPATNVFGKVSK